MAHISAITSTIYSSLDYTTAEIATGRPADETAWKALTFDGAVSSIREFPSMGTPANVVNVPVYGQETSSQVTGQSDAPSWQFTLNYVPSDHASLETLRKEATRVGWRVRLSNTEEGLKGTASEEYDDFYFVGRVAGFEITPSLSDSLQATLTLAIDGEMEGPYTT